LPRDRFRLEGLPVVRYPVSKTGGLRGLGGSTPSPSARRHGRAAEGNALLARRRGARPQVRILLPPFRSGVVERKDARLLTARRRFDPCRRSFACPRGRRAMTPRSQRGRCGFESRRGFLLLAVGESATPPVLGTGDRRFDSCRPDLVAQRGRGAAVLASLMSSRPWVRIPPAPFRIDPSTGGSRK
jgi:hypothetical protein